MTAVQKRALRPTDDTWATGGIKVAYEVWRKSQANYATTGKGGLPSGLVFEFAEKRRAVELAMLDGPLPDPGRKAGVTGGGWRGSGWRGAGDG